MVRERRTSVSEDAGLGAELRARVARSHGPALTRREALKRAALMFGGAAIVGQSAWIAGCATTDSAAFTNRADRPLELDALFDADQIALLDDIAETILPATATPGARAAGVGPFIAVMVADTYTRDEQARFLSGMARIDFESTMDYDIDFLAAAPAQKLSVLERLDREQHDSMRTRRSDAPPHYFRMIKELTLLGYFTSEIGCTQAQRYIEAPGRFDPCLPYSPGDRSWAAHA